MRQTRSGLQPCLTEGHAVGGRSRFDHRHGTDGAPGDDEAGATAVRGGPGFSPTAGLACHQDPGVVEVAGIEPASSDATPGLLRAQFALPLLDPTDHANKSV